METDLNNISCCMSFIHPYALLMPNETEETRRTIKKSKVRGWVFEKMKHIYEDCREKSPQKLSKVNRVMGAVITL